MTVSTNTSLPLYQTLQSLLSCARRLGENRGIERELVDLCCIFRSLWNAMGKEGRILLHHSDASYSCAFDHEADSVGSSCLNSADAYYRRILDSRSGREEDACGPEWIAGDMEQMISAAWDCLGRSEKGKALASPEIAELIDDYASLKLWR